VADVGSGKDTWKATEHQDAVNAMYGHLTFMYICSIYIRCFHVNIKRVCMDFVSHLLRHSEPSHAISQSEAGLSRMPFYVYVHCAGWTMNSTYSLEHSLLVSADDAGVVKLWDTR
jgi:hypothetical protein